MTQYSEQCKQTWIETDTTAINSAIEMAISAQIIKMDEFAYTVCPVCPYMCDSCRFCWGSFVKFRYEDDGQSYKNIMEVLIKAFYDGTRIDIFNFFRTKICKACGSDCKQIYLGTHCTEKYLDQVKNQTPLYHKRTPYLVSKKAIFPLVSISGNTMLDIVNRLWKQNDKTNSKERTYPSEN